MLSHNPRGCRDEAEAAALRRAVDAMASGAPHRSHPPHEKARRSAERVRAAATRNEKSTKIAHTQGITELVRAFFLGGKEEWRYPSSGSNQSQRMYTPPDQADTEKRSITPATRIRIGGKSFARKATTHSAVKSMKTMKLSPASFRRPWSLAASTSYRLGVGMNRPEAGRPSLVLSTATEARFRADPRFLQYGAKYLSAGDPEPPHLRCRDAGARGMPTRPVRTNWGTAAGSDWLHPAAALAAMQGSVRYPPSPRSGAQLGRRPRGSGTSRGRRLRREVGGGTPTVRLRFG